MDLVSLTFPSSFALLVRESPLSLDSSRPLLGFSLGTSTQQCCTEITRTYSVTSSRALRWFILEKDINHPADWLLHPAPPDLVSSASWNSTPRARKDATLPVKRLEDMALVAGPPGLPLYHFSTEPGAGSRPLGAQRFYTTTPGTTSPMACLVSSHRDSLVFVTPRSGNLQPGRGRTASPAKETTRSCLLDRWRNSAPRDAPLLSRILQDRIPGRDQEGSLRGARTRPD